MDIDHFKMMFHYLSIQIMFTIVLSLIQISHSHLGGSIVTLSAPLAGNRTARKLQNFSQKVKKSKSFRLFEFFEFFDFFDFSSRNLLECILECELFDFSTFRIFRFFQFFRLFEQKSPGM